MALRDILEIYFSYVQYFVLLISIQPSPFPAYYQAPIEWLRYLNLDLTQQLSSGGSLAEYVPKGLPLDVRLQFIIVSVMLPLLLALSALVLLAPKTFLLWYGFMMTALLFVVIGLLIIVIDDPIVNASMGDTKVHIYMYAGIGALVVGAIIAVGYQVYYGKKKKEEHQSYEQILEEKVAKLDVQGLAFRVLYIALLVFFALLFLGIIVIKAIMEPGALGPAGNGLAYFLFFVAVCLMVWSIVALTEAGRLMQFKLGEIIKNNFLSVLLLLIAVLYIPAVSNVILVINCQTLGCDAHERLPDAESALNFTVALGCEPCVFAGGQQCSLELQTRLCGAPSASSRLYRDGDIDCRDLRPYFWPASGIMFASFVLTMPIINYVLTDRSTEALADKFPLDTRQAVGLTDEECFEEKVLLSDNVAKFIYDPFQLRWRHWRMLFLFQKLTIVMASVYQFSFEDINVNNAQMAFGLSLFVHAICLTYIMVTRPFKRVLENMLTITTQTLLTLAALTGVIGSQGINVLDPVALSGAIAAFVLPFLALLIGALLTRREAKRKHRARVERIQRAIDDVEEADEDEIEEEMDLDDDTGGMNSTMTMMSLPSRELKRRKSFVGAHGNGDADGTVHVHVRSAPKRLRERRIGTTALPVPPSPTGAEEGEPEKEKSPRNRRRVAARALPTQDDDDAPVATAAPARARRKPLVQRRPKAKQLGDIEMQDLDEDIDVSKDIEADVVLSDGSSDSDNGDKTPLTASHRRPPPKRGDQFAEQPPPPRGEGVMSSRVNLRMDRVTQGSAAPPKHTLQKGSSAAASGDEGPRAPRMRAAAAKAAAAAPWPVGKAKNPLAGPASPAGRNVPKMATGGAVPGRHKAKLKNTPEQSLRARKRWKKLKAHVQRRARENALKRDEAGQGKQLKGWDKLMIMLMQKETAKQTEAVGSDAEVPHMQSNLRDIHSAMKKQREGDVEDEADLRDRLKHLYENHLAKIESLQQGVDFRINEDTLHVLHIFFMAMGTFAILALGCCILGVIHYNAASGHFSPISTPTPTVRSEFAGYDSFDVFAMQCCCEAFTNRTASEVLHLEKWICENGRIKERLRAHGNVAGHLRDASSGLYRETSGLAIRGMCNATLLQGCVIAAGAAYNDGDGHDTNLVAVTGCTAEFSAAELKLW
jgi:hypothetical protein